MLKGKNANELKGLEAERLALLRRTFELAQEHRDELPPSVFGGTNRVDLHVALVQAGFLTRNEFDRLYCKGFYSRKLLNRGVRTPEDRQAMSAVRQLRQLLVQEYWEGVEKDRLEHKSPERTGGSGRGPK